MTTTKEQIASFFDWVQEGINDAQNIHEEDCHGDEIGYCTDPDDHAALDAHGNALDAVITASASLVASLSGSDAWFRIREENSDPA